MAPTDPTPPDVPTSPGWRLVPGGFNSARGLMHDHKQRRWALTDPVRRKTDHQSLRDRVT